MSEEIKLPLSEYFSSWQGEGPFTGRYALFVRFVGCNLACPFCDTAMKRDRESMLLTIDDLEKIIVDEQHRHIVFTGGEPLLRVDLLRKLKPLVEKHKLVVEVETNGTLPIPEDLWDWHFNISPKVWASEKYKTLSIPPKSAFKFPAQKKNLPETLAFIEKFNLPADRVYLMPLCNTYAQYVSSSQEIIDTIKEKKFNFSTRLHIVHYFS